VYVFLCVFAVVCLVLKINERTVKLLVIRAYEDAGIEAHMCLCQSITFT